MATTLTTMTTHTPPVYSVPYYRGRAKIFQGRSWKRSSSREKKIGKQCRYDRDMEEQDEVDNISFRLGARADRYAVDPPPPQPQMDVVMMNASPKVWWLAERSSAVGYAIVVVSSLLGGRGATHMILHARPNRGGGVLCWWRWQRRRQRGKLI